MQYARAVTQRKAVKIDLKKEQHNPRGVRHEKKGVIEAYEVNSLQIKVPLDCDNGDVVAPLGALVCTI